jgi:hypothetical protein
VVIFNYALAAALVSFTNVGPQTQIVAGGEFIVLGIVALAIPSLGYAVMWVYEDSGLRYYDAEKTIISVPISKGVDLVTGVVGIGTFLHFVNLISNNPVQASSIVFALSFILLSPILLAVTIFHHKMEPRMIMSFRESQIAQAAEITIVTKQP